MRIFVTGATGALGSRVVRRLVASGHNVTGVVRTAAKAEVVAAAGATPVQVDLFDPEGTAAAVRGHAVVLNLATHVPPTAQAARASAWAEHDRIRREVSRNLADAAIAHDVDRMVQESICFFYADGGDRWIDEDSPLAPPRALAGAVEAEQQVARLTEGGAAGVALRFGLFYGADAEMTRAGLASARRGLSPFFGRKSDYLPLLHLDDAAAAVESALVVPAGAWNVAEHDVPTKGEAADAMAAAVGRSRLRFVPARVIALGGELPRGLLRSQRASSARFAEATGWRAERAFGTTIADIARQVAAGG